MVRDSFYHHRIKAVFIWLVVASFPSFSAAAPAITSITYDPGFVDGATATITGTDFGNNGPTVTLFDDFESGTSGSQITVGTASLATYGSYWGVDPTGTPEWSNEQKRSGLLSYKADAETDSAPFLRAFLAEPGSNNTTFYLQYNWLVPNDDFFPGEEAAGALNWKIAWAFNSNGGGDVVFNSWIGDPPSFNQIINGNDTPVNLFNGGGPYQQNNAVANHAQGAWNTNRFYVVRGGTDTLGGQIQYNSVTATSGTYVYRSTENMANQYTADVGWNFINFNGFMRTGASPSRVYMDDLYVATGTAARARVEMADFGTYDVEGPAGMTKVQPLVPTSWSDTEITAIVRLGPFTGGDVVYFYVTDAAGSTSSAQSEQVQRAATGGGRRRLGLRQLPSLDVIGEGR